MTQEKLLNLLNRYDIQQQEVIFLRHNENRTYRVNDITGKSYLLRIHDPLIDGMKGLQHTKVYLENCKCLRSWEAGA